MLIKGCARCGGDLFDEEELGQVDLVCLQCGHRVSVAIIGSRALSPVPTNGSTAAEPALPAAGRRS